MDPLTKNPPTKIKEGLRTKKHAQSSYRPSYQQNEDTSLLIGSYATRASIFRTNECSRDSPVRAFCSRLFSSLRSKIEASHLPSIVYRRILSHYPSYL